MKWMFLPLQKYAVFSGRARRREYWLWGLMLFVVMFFVAMMEASMGLVTPDTYAAGPLTTLLSLATLVPNLAVAIRRLHDTGRSGWWILIGLIPIIGLIVMIVFTVQDSEPGENRFGPNPKEIEATLDSIPA